jgi:hypothetical protein
MNENLVSPENLDVMENNEVNNSIPVISKYDCCASTLAIKILMTIAFTIFVIFITNISNISLFPR